MMVHKCSTCKFNDLDFVDEPCASCCDWSTVFKRTGDFKNWQPKPTIDDLQAQLDEVTAERDVANAEIESMHNELAAMTRQRDHYQDSYLDLATKYLNDMDAKKRGLAAKQAIIDQQERELAEVKAELTTRILDDSEFSRAIAKIIAAELQRRAA